MNYTIKSNKKTEEEKEIKLALIARHGPDCIGGIEQGIKRGAPVLNNLGIKKIYYLCIDKCNSKDTPYYKVISFGNINSRIAQLYGIFRIHLWLLLNRNKYDLIYLENILFIKLFSGKPLKILLFILLINYLFLSRFFKKPVIWSIHGVYYPTFLLSSKYKILTKFMIFLVKISINYFVFFNERGKTEIEHFLNVPRERMYKMIEDYDPKLFYPPSLEEKLSIRKKLGIPHNFIVITSIAGKWDEKIKNAVVLLETWKLLCQKFNNILLLLIGPEFSSPLTSEKVKKFIENNKEFLKNIIVTGIVSCPWIYIKAADICFHPSTTEAFPRAVIESMACGLPVVGLKTEGMVDLIIHGWNGFLASKNNAEDFFEYLSLLIEDKELRKNMGLNATLSVKDFTTEKKAKIFLKLCYKALSISKYNEEEN